ncbi:MAG: glycosyltransferase family 4 protein, partial [Vicinamibacteria bacterium]
HPGSVKSWLDRFLLFRPMKAAREDLCQKASALVTPLPRIIPPSVPREKIHPVHWGANVDMFQPGVTASGSAKELPIPNGASVVVFSSSFRPWHGAELLVRAAVRVLERSPNAFFLLLGAGPMLAKVKQHAEELGVAARVHCTGAVRYEEMPRYLARAHLGAAPYQPSLHGQLQLGFYWSPLKIFEYMASGLPVVTLDIEPLREIVRPGLEGLLFPENHTERLAEAIGELVNSPERARAMGQSARQRIVSLYSWQVHCEALERVLAGVTEGAGA